MDYSQMMRMGGGMVGGMGQGLMSQDFRRTYGAARSGGYGDLMENQNIQDFVTGDEGSRDLTKRFQDLRSRMLGPGRGMQQPMPVRPIQ